MAGAQRGEERSAITCSADGFTVRDPRGSEIAVRWDQVRGIAAYKRDLFTVDEIRLAFRLHGGDEWVDVCEEDLDYAALVDEIQRRYPDYNRAWNGQVSQPPFAHCWTIVWGDVPPVLSCQRCGYDLEHLDGTLRCPECGHSSDPMICPTCGGTGHEGPWKSGDIVLTACWLVAALAVAHVLFGPPPHPGFMAALVAVVLASAIYLSRERRCPDCGGTGRRWAWTREASEPEA